MESPAAIDSESIRDEKIKVLKAIQTIGPEDVVRGQFKGYLSEAGVKPDSKTETFAAMKMSINSPRWKGVPIYIQAGKKLPVTSTEILVRLKNVTFSLFIPGYGSKPSEIPNQSRCEFCFWHAQYGCRGKNGGSKARNFGNP